MEKYRYDYNGNMTWRHNYSKDLKEQFSYDELNRLTSIYRDNALVEEVEYDVYGNVCHKRSVGDITYHPGTNRIDSISFSGSVIPADWTIRYNSDLQIVSIEKEFATSSLTIDYDADGRKTQCCYDRNKRRKRVVYMDNLYQEETFDNQTVFRNYVLVNGQAVAIIEQTINGSSINYLHRDHIGSIIAVSDEAGEIVSEFSYDPWGRPRSPMTWELLGSNAIEDRNGIPGFCSLENIDLFDVVHMNGRIYDPWLGRFLSPDPYVQDPTDFQNFNRYIYCFNNPLVNTDNSGKFVISFFTGFIKGLFTGKNPFVTGWKQSVNSIKITAGLLTTDKNKSFWGRAWELISRFTWQIHQTFIGFGYNKIANAVGQVSSVHHLYGATVVNCGWSSPGQAVTLGPYISGGSNLKADPTNSLFQHEYGHYIQSQRMGLGYLFEVGLPSIKSAANSKQGEHKLKWFELDANEKSLEYLKKYFGEKQGAKMWHFDIHPIKDRPSGKLIYSLKDYENRDKLDDVKNDLHF